jgi:hypothetical protein
VEIPTPVRESMKESKHLAAILTPTTLTAKDGWRITHAKHRWPFLYFTDGIPFGLLMAKWIGDKLGADTPFIDEVITWAQNLRRESFVDPTTGKINSDYCLKEKYTSGIPEAYCITSMEDILD